MNENNKAKEKCCNNCCCDDQCACVDCCPLNHFPLHSEVGRRMAKKDTITICGIGSLLDQKSAVRTFPNLQNYRLGIIEGYTRAFNLVAVSCIYNGFASLESKQVASVSACKIEDIPESLRKPVQDNNRSGDKLYVVLFEIPMDHWDYFLKREHRYEYEFVAYNNYDVGKKASNETTNCCGGDCCCSCCKEKLDGYALVCCQSTDDSYRSTKCGNDEQIYHQLVGQYYDGKIWYHSSSATESSQPEILPVSKYITHVLRHCLLLGDEYNLGMKIFDNWLDGTYLADFKTSLRTYLETSMPSLLQEVLDEHKQSSN